MPKGANMNNICLVLDVMMKNLLVNSSESERQKLFSNSGIDEKEGLVKINIV